MKKFAILCLASLIILSTAAFAAAQITIQLSHDLPEDTPQHMGSLKFKEVVESKSEGKIMVEVFPAGQLGSDIETVELLQIGSIQASLVPTAKLCP